MQILLSFCWIAIAYLLPPLHPDEGGIYGWCLRKSKKGKGKAVNGQLLTANR
jgi:hypothetical protein